MINNIFLKLDNIYNLKKILNFLFFYKQTKRNSSNFTKKWVNLNL